MAKCMLTTIDNPINPLSDFKKWLEFEIEHGYDTSGYLARFANVTDDMSDEEQEEQIERAIDFIVATNPFGIYYKVSDPNLKPTTLTLGQLYDSKDT